MENIFTAVEGLTSREQAISQLVLQLALHVDAEPALANQAGFDGRQISRLQEMISNYERELSTASPTLSSLLAKNAKSSCCS